MGNIVTHDGETAIGLSPLSLAKFLGSLGDLFIRQVRQLEPQDQYDSRFSLRPSQMDAGVPA
jgi:hypothetical protein